jgi:tripartite ATP-independent transporter DctM subunit
MTDPQLGMLMLGLFIFIIMLGFPIAFTLMAMGVSFGYYAYYTAGQDFFENRIFTLLVQKTFEVTSSDVLVAVPLFLFMGYLIERANILDRLFYALQLSMKNVPGALAVATLITCAMFATATGIVGAVVTLMGLLALPAMLRAGYDTKLSAGVVCAGGCLGILIPPSILLIVYAATAGVSAVKLYAAAFFPGFLLAGLYVLYAMARAIINPALAPKLPPEQTNVPLSTVMWALATSFLPLALLIVSVLGAILLGLATPSEAAAVGALMSIVLAAAYRSLNYTMMRESVYLTVRATAMVCYLFIGSWTFSAVFAVLGGQTVVEQFFASMNRDHHHIRADLPAAASPVWHRSDLLRHPGCAEHADSVQHAAGRDGRLLSEGRGAAGGEAHRHLLRRASLRRPGLLHHGAGLHLPGNRVVVARLPLWIAVSRLGKTLKGCA